MVAIEVKAPRGTLSHKQYLFLRDALYNDCYVYVVSSLPEVQFFIDDIVSIGKSFKIPSNSYEAMRAQIIRYFPKEGAF